MSGVERYKTAFLDLRGFAPVATHRTISPERLIYHHTKTQNQKKIQQQQRKQLFKIIFTVGHGNIFLQ